MKALFCVVAALAALHAAPVRAGGDAVNGKYLYASRCIACHAIDVNLAGPMHRGVFGRKAGTVPEYDYSPALRNSGVRWTAPMLDRWLQNPQAFIPGQKMGYAVTDAQDRADLIAYLKTLSAR